MKRALVVLAIGIGCGTPASGALADASDTASTTAYLRADRTYLREDIANLRSGQAALHNFAARTTAACPDIAAPTLHETGVQASYRNEVALEIFYAAGLAIMTPDRLARIKFADAIERLHWSNRKLRRLVREYTAAERAEAAFTVPDLCADFRTWAASEYGPPPASTASFLKRAIGLPDPSQEILSLIAPHPRARARDLVRSVKDLEGQAESSELNAVGATTTHMDEALGFQPPINP